MADSQTSGTVYHLEWEEQIITPALLGNRWETKDQRSDISTVQIPFLAFGMPQISQCVVNVSNTGAGLSISSKITL